MSVGLRDIFLFVLSILATIVLVLISAIGCCVKMSIYFLCHEKTGIFNFGLVSLPDTLDFFFIDDYYCFQTKPHATVAVTYELEGTPSYERICADIQNSLLLKDDKGNEIAWKLKTYPINILGYWFWAKCKDFHVKNHVFLMEPPENSNLPDIYDEIHCAKYEYGHPPWRVTLIQNFGYNGRESGKSVVVIGFSHCCFDGISAANMYNGFAGGKFASMAYMTQPTTMKNDSPSIKERLVEIVKIFRYGPWELLDITTRPKEFNWLTRCRTDPGLGVRWRHCSTQPMSMERLRTARRHFRCSTYALIIASIMRGVARFLKSQNHLETFENESVSMILPYGSPNHPVGFKNHWRPMTQRFPLTSAVDLGFSEYLAKVEKEVDYAHNLRVTEYTLAFIFPMFANVPLGAGFKYANQMVRGLTMIGSISPMGDYMPPLFGCPVKTTYHFMPLTRYDLAGLSWACMTTKDTFRVSLATDVLTMSQSELNSIGEHIGASFEQVLNFEKPISEQIDLANNN